MRRPWRAGGEDEESQGHRGNFFEARYSATLRAWFQKHLGVEVQAWGGAAFTWTSLSFLFLPSAMRLQGGPLLARVGSVERKRVG
jgi:hypothetical protein